ncbi:MAG TPA: DEAD/DEAH box helicase [Myxococcaceae bacterium]|nr:DEAD/DEAH box helicase [Myxococcaceae bacterium]
MAIHFESMHLRAELVAACRKQGFREPTPIQRLAIPVVMQGRDAVVEAKTGSGKTLAYGLPLLHREPSQTQFPEVLVLAPTRELAEQIEGELTRSRGTLERRIACLTGGGGMDQQRVKLEAGVTVAVGTIGRIEELLARNLLRLGHLRTLVLDEADELLRGGFSKNLSALLKQLPGERQTLLFSATLPNEVEQIAREFMRQPERLRLTQAREQVAELSHRVLRTTVGERMKDLSAFLNADRPFQALVFCGTRHETESVQDALVRLGHQAEFLHGELSPVKRRKLLEHFRCGDLPILVASDLGARGLDLPGVDLVVNYSLPDGALPYLHRAGRTGRAGKPGKVVTLLIEQQQDRFRKLQETLTFESVEVHKGHLVVKPLKSREERDLQYRKLPRHVPKSAEVPREESRRTPAGRGRHQHRSSARRTAPRPAKR